MSTKINRIFAISDLHLDYPANLQWLSELSLSEYQTDVLILAGDISDMPYLLDRCFEILTRRFAKVLFVPGNHDLWVLRKPTPEHPTSIDKFYSVCEIAAGFGVGMQPFHVGQLSIVPLLSWYDFSFGQPSGGLMTAWMDFHVCKWPTGFDNNKITDFFIKQNEPSLAVTNKTVITFSHFLPRIDLMPSFIPPQHRVLYPVLGSNLIDKQIRQLKSSIHIYGHSHLNRHVKIDGVLYINNAFGSPAETHITAKELRCILEL